MMNYVRHSSLRRLLAALGLLAASNCQAGAAEIEILSKADAVRLFGLTKDQWLQEVGRAVASGVAQRTPGDQRFTGMATTTAKGDIVTIRLDYSKGDERPSFIQVILGYRSHRARLFNDRDFPDLLAAAQRQMAPEFDVIGNAERLEGGLGVFLTILERQR